MNMVHEKFFTILFSFLLLTNPNQVFSEPRELFGLNFFSGTDRPLRVLTFQPLPGVWDSIDYIDKSSSRIDRNTEWINGANADLWAFFLRDRDDIALLPSIAAQVLEQLDGGDDAILGGGVTIQRGDSRDRVLMMFFFVDEDEEAGLVSQGCRYGVAIFDELIEEGGFDRDLALERCE